MASSIKVGIAALAMLAVVAGTGGRSEAGFTCTACIFQIDDLSETPTVTASQNGQDITSQAVFLRTTGQVELLIFDTFGTGSAISQTRYADLFEDQVDGVLSDRVLVVITPLASANVFQATVTFASARQRGRSTPRMPRRWRLT